MENQYEDLADGLEYIYIQCIYKMSLVWHLCLIYVHGRLFQLSLGFNKTQSYKPSKRLPESDIIDNTESVCEGFEE